MKIDNKDYIFEKETKLLLETYKLGRFVKAEIKAKKLLKRYPGSALIFNFLGIVLSTQNKNDEAILNFKNAIKIKNDYLEAHDNLANALQTDGKVAEAIEIYKSILKIKPNYAQVYNNLGIALFSIGKIDSAIVNFKNAFKIKPDYSEAYNNLGSALRSIRKFNKAIILYQKAIKLNPNFFEAYHNLGKTLKDLNKIDEAITQFQKSIKIKSDYAEAYNSWGNALISTGNFNEAIYKLKKAIDLKPNYLEAHSDYLFCLTYDKKFDPEYHLSEAKKFYRAIKTVNYNSLEKYQFLPKPQKLRIGFISGDFYNHPVGHFILSTLRHLKNKNLELVAYSNSFIKDDMTVQIKSQFQSWNTIVNQKDMNLINQIRKDGIHILIDLSGHTGKNRLPIFVHRPAPIQATWAGYAASTGIKEIDYLIGDPHVTPKEQEHFFVEKIFRLPNIWCSFTPPDFKSKYKSLPALKNGFITFGCFNNISKVNDEVINLWSELLNAIPNTKLFLKAHQLDNKKIVENIRKKFEKNSVKNERLILEGKSLRKEFLKTYQKIDIALDPFPYTGGTTSFETIWMGVPLFTLKGKSFLSQCGASINYNIGMKDWIAENKKEYVPKLIKLTSNVDQLAAVKSKLNKKVISSPLFDSVSFADDFDKTLWKMWNDFNKNK